MEQRLSTRTWRSALNPLRTAGLALVLMCAQGCIYFVPQPYSPIDVTRIKNEEIELIRVGETRRGDIHRQLGRPQHNFGDGTRWLFVVKKHRDGGVQWCGGDVWTCTEKKDDQTIMYLDISFDDSGIVENRRIFSVENGKFVNKDELFDPRASTFIYASSDDDQAAKRFVAEPGQCAIYLYMSQAPGAIYVQIDETLPRTRFGSETTFLRFDIDSGIRRIAFFDKYMYSWREIGEQSATQGQLSETIEIDCSIGNVILMQGQINENNNLVVNFVPDAEGRPEIEKRTLIRKQF